MTTKLIGALLVLLLCSGMAHSQTITSKRDSLGYTHYQGSTKSGERIQGTSKTDSLGYTHSQWRIGDDRYRCTAKTDSLGYRRERCN